MSKYYSSYNQGVYSHNGSSYNGSKYCIGENGRTYKDHSMILTKTEREKAMLLLDILKNGEMIKLDSIFQRINMSITEFEIMFAKRLLPIKRFYATDMSNQIIKKTEYLQLK